MRKERPAEHGVALVTTMIILAVMAVVAVAFMQTTTIDRFSARSVANHTRAKLAAEAGLAAASAALARATTNDTFIVVTNGNRQLFVGNGVPGSTNFSFTPMFSVAPGLTNAISNVVSSVVPQSYASQGVTTNFPDWELPGGLSIASPPSLSWVYLTTIATNAAGNLITNTNACFAYWVEDLGGRLDLSVVGTTNSDVARRPTGTNPAEIALWSLFSAGKNEPGNATSTKLVSSRSNILTAATARLVDLAVTNQMMADLAVGLVHESNEPELIPFGFGYADGGQPKFNLNTNINEKGVDAISQIIRRNLPQFAERAGGYTNSSGGGATNTNAYTIESYLQTLAASMIDYADTDSNPTTDGTSLGTNRVRPVYRGVDSYPFVNEISKRWVMTRNAITNEGATQGRAIVIETTDFVELWNPGSQAAQGNFTFLSVHRQTGSAGFQAISFANPTWASNAVGAVFDGVSSNTIPVNVAPNGFAVYALPTVTNFFFVPLTNSNAVILNGEIDSSRYHAAWNATYYDAVLAGLYRAPGSGQWSPLGLNAPTNRANLPSFIYRSAGGGGFGDPAVGDPRATIYLSRPADATAWDRTSFGGRNDRGISGQPYGAVSPKTWPDAGHDSLRGSAATAQSVLPTAIAPAAYSNVPPGRISNAGEYSNVTELGAIFDPIQWSVSALGAWRGRWTNLPASAAADNGYGGGNTLRVGRAEHPRFAADGLRAAQLLDLFAVGVTNSNGIVLRSAPGFINLNTATTNVLRALAAGVHLTSDPSLSPDSTNFVIPANAVRAFVEGVTNFRSSRPFVSVNQVPSISTNGNQQQWPTNSVFGNSNLAGINAWNDAAAEEWFRRLHTLSTVRSRNFLVHVVGQALATNNPNPSNPLSTQRLSVQVYLAPQRTNGVTTNSQPRVLRSWDL